MKQSKIDTLIKEATKNSTIGKSGKDLIESLELKSGKLFDKLLAVKVLKEANYLEIDQELTAYTLKLIKEKRNIKFVQSIFKKLIKVDPSLIKFLYHNEKPKQKEQKKNPDLKEVRKERKFNSNKSRWRKKVTINSKPKFRDLKTIYNKLENKDTKSIATLLGNKHKTVNIVFERFQVDCKEPISYNEFLKAKDWLLTQYDRKLNRDRKIKVSQVDKTKKPLKSKNSVKKPIKKPVKKPEEKSGKSSWGNNIYKYPRIKFISTGMK